MFGNSHIRNLHEMQKMNQGQTTILAQQFSDSTTEFSQINVPINSITTFGESRKSHLIRTLIGTVTRVRVNTAGLI